MYYIYKLISPSGKCYIGQTRQESIQIRFEQHIGAHIKWVKQGKPHKTYNPKMMYALDKYPYDQWTIEELAQTESSNEIDLLEQKYIKEFNSVENGYNIQNGGQGWHGLELAEEHKENIGQARKEYFDTEDGQEWKKELSKKWSIHNPSYINHPKGFLNKSHSEESKKKTSETLKRKYAVGEIIITDERRERARQLGYKNKGRIHLEETKKLLKQKQKNRLDNNNHNFLGDSLQKQLLAEGRHASQKEYECPNCGKRGKGGAFKRWHFDNCKDKN